MIWNYCRRNVFSFRRLTKGIRCRSDVTATKYSFIRQAYYSKHINSEEKTCEELPPVIKCISESFIKPKYKAPESNKPYYLAPLELGMLSWYIPQYGFIYNKCSNKTLIQDFSIHSFVESLKESLSLSLVHFYPLAGRLVSNIDEDKHESIIFVDCNKGPGVKFIHASIDMTISDIMSPNDIPLAIRSFFDLGELIMCYDSHIKPLLSVQVTELVDGVFVACSINHCMIDGASFWHFWSVWCKIHREKTDQNCEKSFLPVFNRRLPHDHTLPIPFPFTHPKEFVRHYESPPIKERIFYFSSDSIAKLKAKANDQNNSKNISSFQALCAHLWRSMVRANRLPHDQVIYNYFCANLRPRLEPPAPNNHFGSFLHVITVTTTAGELLENDLGWGASLLHKGVANLNDKFSRDYVNKWIESPCCYYHADLHDLNSVTIENSPRFDMYGNDFGLGKPLAIRSGYANKAPGVVYACPGLEEGSVEFEVCLPPDSMDALDSDEEFKAFVSLALP